MPVTSRLTSSGSQLVNNEFDEVSLAAGSIAFSGAGTTTTFPSINTPASTSLNLYTANSTVECWFNLASYSTGSNPTADATLFSFYSGSAATYYAVKISNTGFLKIAKDGGGAASDTSTTAIALNTWYHFAWIHTANTTTNVFYINGANVTSTFSNPSLTNTFPLNPATSILYIGATYYNNTPYTYIDPLIGYISNLRVVRGTQVYTGNFTPPQSILPAIANTQLLLNTTDPTNFIKDSSSNNFTLTNNNTATYNVNSPFGINNTGSINLAGNTQWLSIPSSTGLDLGDPGYPTTVSGPDFTIELWFYCTSFSSGITIIDKDGVAATSYSQYGYSISSGGSLTFYVGHGDNASTGTGTQQNFTVGTVSLNTWYHVAACQSSTNQIKVFLDGTLVSTTTRTQLMVDGGKPLLVGWSQDQSTASRFPGYITNFRILKNTALYSTSFTPAGPLYPITNTSVLLNACDSSIFLRDSSQTNATVTNNGTATFSSFRPSTGFLLTSRRMTSDGMLEVINQFDEVSFTPGSWALSGSSGVTVGNSSVFALPGDFTVEFFFYLSSVPSTEIDFWESQTNTTFRILKRGSSSGLSYDAYGGTSYLIASDASIPTNSWNHVAVSRTGTTIQAYFNGTRTINQTDTTSFGAPTADYSVGCRATGVNGLSGSISNFRLVKGAGMYTGATIPVPSAPLGNVSGTQLLLPTPYTGGAFFDYSTNNFTVTKVSTPTSGSVSPFTVNTPQRLTSTGILQVENDFDEVSLTAGSVAFSGSGQYLSTAANSVLDLPGDFTIESWVYPTGSKTTADIIAGRWISGDRVWLLNFGASTNLVFQVNGATLIAYSFSITYNRWYHVAVTRSGTTVTLWLNGVSVGTATSSYNFTSATRPLLIGRNGDSTDGTQDWLGYMSNFRIVKGTAVYTSTFTPPQSVLPAITNTQLLLNVIDSANFITDSSSNKLTMLSVGPATWTASGPFNS